MLFCVCVFILRQVIIVFFFFFSFGQPFTHILSYLVIKNYKKLDNRL